MQKKTSYRLPRAAAVLYTLGALFVCLAIFMFTQITVVDFGTTFIAVCAIFCAFYGTLYAAAAFGGKSSKWLKFVCKVILILIILFLLSFAIVTSIIAVNGKTKTIDTPHTPDSGVTDYCLVFGAKANGLRPSLALATRLDAAGEYLEDNMDFYVIFSGGQGENEVATEAEVMRKYFSREYSFLTSHQITEDMSRNTEENIRFSKKIMDERGGEYTVTAVSNNYHLYRIKTLMKRAGIEEIYTISAPNPNISVTISLYIREYFAVIAMWLGI